MRRLAVRELSVHLAFMEKDTDFNGNDNSVATNLDMDLLVGLKKCATLNVMKILGAMLDLFFPEQEDNGCKWHLHSITV